MDASDLVQVGRVVKPHGLRGEVVVDVMTDLPERFAAGATIHVDGRAVEVLASRPHQGRLLVLFAGVDGRDGAEALRGAALMGEPVSYDETDVYWAHEIVGLSVQDTDGASYGVVQDLIELPEAAGYDLLEVAYGTTTWLLPATDELVEVEELDGEFVLVVVDPPAGLLPGTEDVDDGPDTLGT